jgi:hypothetical protein
LPPTLIRTKLSSVARSARHAPLARFRPSTVRARISVRSKETTQSDPEPSFGPQPSCKRRPTTLAHATACNQPPLLRRALPSGLQISAQELSCCSGHDVSAAEIDAGRGEGAVRLLGRGGGRDGGTGFKLASVGDLQTLRNLISAAASSPARLVRALLRPTPGPARSDPRGMATQRCLGTLPVKASSGICSSREVPMKTKSAERLRELARQCVTGAYRSTDEDAAAILLEIASSLLELASGKANSHKRADPALVNRSGQPI